jgi:hypothetical protein
MAILETLTIKLGGAVSKALVKSWIGDGDLLADTSSDVAELLAASGLDFREKRRVSRELEEVTERVAERLQPFFEAEQFGGLPENERNAAAIAVARTIEHGFTRPEVALTVDLDAQRLAIELRAALPSAADDALLNASARHLYDIALQESCAYLIAMVENLPRFQGQAFAELLARDHAIIEKLDEALDHLPPASVERALEFETRYRREIARHFDQLQLFGLSSETDIHRYKLSVAYLSLTAAIGRSPAVGAGEESELDAEFTALRAEREAEEDEQEDELPEEAVVKVDTVVSSSPRLLVRGDAGSGKTTLLQWLAVNAARGSFAYPLANLNHLIPFVIQLRRFADAPLPGPSQFVEAATPMITGLMPSGWTEKELERGHALVLIDGVDELRADRRDEVRRWLEDLLGAFPSSRVVVTSRPPAVDGDWLETAGFDHCALEPMGLADIEEFIEHWHAAVAGDASEQERATLLERRRQIQRVIRKNAPLRRLATNPLLCAMLCAVNRKDEAQLPDDRVELYRIVLDALLQKRDAARRVKRLDLPQLSLQKKLTLLQELAYWLVRNGYTDAPRDLATKQLERTLARVAPELDASDVFDSLLQRTGLLREPVQDSVDFIHRTFLEYLAALAVVDHDDIGVLIEHAPDDAWSEIIVLASGSAIQSQRHELIEGLLDYDGDDGSVGHRCDFLAVACLDSAPELDPDLSERVRRRLAERLPAQSLGEAGELAAAGALAVGLLGPTAGMRVVEAQASIRALGLIGTDEAMEQIALYGADERVTVVRELIRQWTRFDVIEYAASVMADSPLEQGHLDVGETLPVAVTPYLRRLRSLGVSGEPLDFSDLATIEALPLETLILASDASIEDLTSLGCTDTLTTLGLYDQPWLETLAGIGRFHKLQSLRVEGSGELMELLAEGERWPPALMSLTITGADILDVHTLSSADLMFLALGAHQLVSFEAIGDLERLVRLQLMGVETDLDLFPLVDLDRLRLLEIADCTANVEPPPARVGEPLGQLSILRTPSLYRAEALWRFGGAANLHLAGAGGLTLAEIGALDPSSLVIEDPTIRSMQGLPATLSEATICCPLESLAGAPSSLQQLSIYGYSGGDTLDFDELPAIMVVRIDRHPRRAKAGPREAPTSTMRSPLPSALT